MRQLRVEQLSILIHEVYTRRARVVPRKHGMADLILALKEADIKSEAIPVHMHQVHIEKQQLKYNNETPTVMVHVGKINKTTTLTLPNEEDWRQAISENHDIGYIKRILSSPEETLIDPK